METKSISENYCMDIEGNIYSKVRSGSKGGVMKHGLDGWGYPTVKLHINGEKKTRHVHRILAELFIPNPKNLPQVNHIDGNKMNLSIKNLEWCTGSENIKHSIRNGMRKYTPMSGQKYVYYEKQTKSYRVIVYSRDKKHRLGRFPTLSEALKIRDEFMSSTISPNRR